MSWMNTEAKTGRAENEQETRLAGLSVPGANCFSGGSDVSHMKVRGVFPLLVVMPRGDGRIPLLSSGQHFNMARAFGELALPSFPPSPQLCHFGCNGTSCGFGWSPVCSPLGRVVGVCV